MKLKLKTAPAIEPITLDEAKNHLKVDSADDNTLIGNLITTARELAERETKRAFITQTWQLIFDLAPHMIEIPKPPLQSIESITIIDTDGDETQIDEDDYVVDASENSPGRVTPDLGLVWPYHRGFASFIVEFKCGYGTKTTDVPTALRQGILQLIGYLYENRGTVEIPKSLKSMFFPYKILGF